MDIKVLKKIRSIASPVRKNTLPILDCFYIDQDYVYMSDLEISIKLRHHFPIIKGCLLPILISADHFLQRIAHISSPWGIFTDVVNKVTFRSPSGDTKIPAKEAIDFTSINIMPLGPGDGEKERHIYDITAYELSIMIQSLQFTADDELRPVMTQVLLDEEHIVASDAHKLIYTKRPKKTNERVMFPVRVLRIMEIMKNQDYALWVVGRNYVAVAQDITIWWRIQDPVKDDILDIWKSSANYPIWQRVLPSEFRGQITVGVKEMIRALKNIKFALNKASNQIRFTITDDRLLIDAKNYDEDLFAQESISIWNEVKNNIQFGFKYEYLMQILLMFDRKGYSQMEMKYVDPSKCFIFNDEILLMPMMLNE